MRCSPPPITAAPLPRSNMTAPESNFCCATDLALMSEPGVYGVGIIGIVSFRPDSGTLHNPRSTGAAPDHNVTIVINPPLRPTCLAAVIYGNRAVTRCEMDEQTGSVSETKRPPSGRKEVEVLTVSWPRCTKSTIFLIFAPWPFASACAVSIKAREASYARRRYKATSFAERPVFARREFEL